jgi:hypothetical protein
MLQFHFQIVFLGGRFPVKKSVFVPPVVGALLCLGVLTSVEASGAIATAPSVISCVASADKPFSTASTFVYSFGGISCTNGVNMQFYVDIQRWHPDGYYVTHTSGEQIGPIWVGTAPYSKVDVTNSLLAPGTQKYRTVTSGVVWRTGYTPTPARPAKASASVSLTYS